MIDRNLHRDPVPLDNARHRALRLALPVADWSPAAGLNAVFVAACEFGDVCGEFPIVFVRVDDGPDGKEQVAPLAVLGLVREQNLYLAGSAWRARYMPAVLRNYPFCIGRLDAQRLAVCVDMAWAGVRPGGCGDGVALFEGDGQPAPLLKEMQQRLQVLEGEIERTRHIGARLLELGLLGEMQFSATLADGSIHRVDGFLTVDDKKMQDLPDAVVGELHRSGILGLIHQHWVSLGHMRGLVERHLERSRGLPASLPVAGTTAGPAAPSAPAVPTTRH